MIHDNFNQDYATNGVFYTTVDDDEYYGFVITHGAELHDDLVMEADHLSMEERLAHVDRVHGQVQERGYQVGEIKKQSYYAWLVEAFGYAGTYEEFQAWQTELDQQEDDVDEQL